MVKFLYQKDRYEAGQDGGQDLRISVQANVITGPKEGMEALKMQKRKEEQNNLGQPGWEY